jgi:magnesium-transporting ATPase (P-type)
MNSVELKSHERSLIWVGKVGIVDPPRGTVPLATAKCMGTKIYV